MLVLHLFKEQKLHIKQFDFIDYFQYAQYRKAEKKINLYTLFIHKIFGYKFDQINTVIGKLDFVFRH